MSDLRTAAEQALEALENTSPLGFNMEADKKFFAAITALRAALAEPGRFGTTCKPECTPKDRTTVPAHAEGCWSWGPRHYLCALDEIRRLKSELESNR